MEGLWFNPWRGYGLTFGGAMVLTRGGAMVQLLEGLWFNSWRSYGLIFGGAIV